MAFLIVPCVADLGCYLFDYRETSGLASHRLGYRSDEERTNVWGFPRRLVATKPDVPTPLPRESLKHHNPPLVYTRQPKPSNCLSSSRGSKTALPEEDSD